MGTRVRPPGYWGRRVRKDMREATGKMCPLSPAIPTKMTKSGFIQACKRTRAGGKYKLESENWFCPDCPIAKAVDGDLDFKPPGHIQFITLTEFDREGDILEIMVKKIKLRRDAGTWPLLTPEIVAFIRSWHKTRPDISQKKMAEIFGISRRHVGRIIHGERWRE